MTSIFEWVRFLLTVISGSDEKKKDCLQRDHLSLLQAIPIKQALNDRHMLHFAERRPTEVTKDFVKANIHQNESYTCQQIALFATPRIVRAQRKNAIQRLDFQNFNHLLLFLFLRALHFLVVIPLTTNNFSLVEISVKSNLFLPL